MEKHVFRVDWENEDFATLKDAKYYLTSLTPSELRNLYNRCEGRIEICHFFGDEIISITIARPNDDYSRVFFGRPTAF